MEKMIKLSHTPQGWMAEFVGDAKIQQLFGTQIIPTAFTAQAEFRNVAAEIARLNPGYAITI